MSVLAACLAVGLTLALVPAGAGATAPKAPSAKAQVRAAYSALLRDTRQTPLSAVSRRNRAKVISAVKRSRRAHRRRPCRSLRRLGLVRRRLRKVKVPRTPGGREQPTGAPSPRGKLRADVVRVQSALMALPRARRCGGGERGRVQEPQTTVLESTERLLKLRVLMPPPTFSARQVGKQDFIQMHMESMGESGDVGEPGLPIVSELFAIPQGADVSMNIDATESYVLKGINLFPTQVQPVDQRRGIPGQPDFSTFADPPFAINEPAYDSAGPFPERPANAGVLGAMRDLRVGAVDTAGGQYNPGRNELRIFTSIDVTVNFGGDNRGDFGPDTLLNKWNLAYLDQYASLVNFPTVREHLIPDIRTRFCGEELLIVTSAALRPAANALHDAREAQGYITRVVETGTGAGQIGTTPAQIQSFIRGEMLDTNCLVHPQYVILFGNTAHVPTFLVPCSPGGNPDECNIASDLDYSTNGIGTDLFADVQLGRLPAPTLDAANALVTKLTTYEAGPVVPAGDDFYDHAAVTSYFQPALICVLNEGATGTPNCDTNAPPVTGHWEIDYANTTDTRGFTITAERIRNAIASEGYAVDRLYTTDDEDVNPLTYWNGTPIPNHLRRPTFAWDANTTDFFDTYNDGRFVILHRDHGWPDGWAEPTLHSGHVPLFTNGAQQPVVFGINCSSAAFDEPAHPSFVELQVLRPDGGAIAGFGDTRVSPSFPNNHMALGFFDAFFPLTVSDYGPDVPTRRLGDVLVRGKQYMATQEGFEWHGAGDTYVEHYLYHLLGDPTMQMWANPPVRFDPNRFRWIKEIVQGRYIVKIDLPDPPPESLGGMVTLLENGTPIGRGIFQGGHLEISPEVENSRGENLQIVFQQDGAQTMIDEVEGDEPRGQQPQAEPEPTSLSQNCPKTISTSLGPPFTVSGRLSPGFGGAPIYIKYTRPDGSTFERNVTTASDGDWSDTMNPIANSTPNNRYGTWKAQARFDGDATHGPSTAQECTVVVND